MEINPAIREQSFRLCCDHNIPGIKVASLVETFIINTQVIRKRLTKFGIKKSESSDGVPGEILKLRGEGFILCLARLLEI